MGTPKQPLLASAHALGVRKSDPGIRSLGSDAGGRRWRPAGRPTAGVGPGLGWPRLQADPGFTSRTDWVRSVTVPVAEETRTGRP